MEYNPSTESNSSSASKESPLTLWNLQVNYGVHNSLSCSLFLTRSIQFMPFHTISFKTTLTVFSHLCSGLPCGLYVRISLLKLYFSSLHHMLQVPSISLTLILLSWEYVAEYKPWNFSRNFLQPCYFLPLGSKTVLSTLFSYRLSPCSSLDVINQVSLPHKNMQNYS